MLQVTRSLFQTHHYKSYSRKWILDFFVAFSAPSLPPPHVTQKKSCYHGRWKSNEKHLSRWLLFFWLNDWWLFGFFASKSSSGLSKREKIDFHMEFFFSLMEKSYFFPFESQKRTWKVPRQNSAMKVTFSTTPETNIFSFPLFPRNSI
jgi:hypothetical protein